jgi:hypothetical protein
MIRKHTLQQYKHNSDSSNTDDTRSSGQSDDSTVDLGFHDVVCGRHKAAFNNIGNRRFRVIVSLALERFTNAPTRKDKSIVIKSVADVVRGCGGHFLQRQGGNWIELDEKQTHEKVGHALRDMAMASKTKSEVCIRPRTPSPTTTKSGYFPIASDTPTQQVSSEIASSKEQQMAADFVESVAVTSVKPFELPANHSTEIDSMATEKVDATSIEPIPWQPGQIQEARRDSVFDANILAWLVDESTSILHNSFETRCC